MTKALYTIKSPKTGELLWKYLAENRKDAMFFLISGDNDLRDWREAYAMGFRCVKVKLTEVKS